MKYIQEIKVSLIVLGGIVLFLVGFNFLNGTSLLNKENTLYAVYDNVEGLKVGTSVTVNGLMVGKVNAINFLPQSTKLLVTFSLRSDIAFSKNSIAELYEAGLIGGKSIAILPVFDQERALLEGDTLPSQQKPGLTDVLSQQIEPLQQKLESVLTKADTLFEGVNEVLNEEGKANLTSTLNELSKTVNKINALSSTLNDLLGSEENGLANSLQNVNAITQNLNQVSDSLAQANLKGTIAKFEETATQLNLLLNDINSGKGSLGKLMQDEGLYQNLEASTKEVELLLKDLKAHPKRYVHFSLFGKKDTPYQTPNED